jgi:hypothetical protein
LPGLPVGDAQFDQLPVAEQRLRLICGQQFAPLETALHRQYLALGKTLRPCGLADFVGRFQRQQMLVAGDHVQRRE